MLLETPTNEMLQAMRLRTVSLKRDGEYWTEEEKRQLQDMFEAGYGLSTISYNLQRSEVAIYQQIEKQDLYRRKENPQRRSYTKNPCGCLCDTCSCDPRVCPRYKAGENVKEAG